jgi:hypothetical protein
LYFKLEENLAIKGANDWFQAAARFQAIKTFGTARRRK